MKELTSLQIENFKKNLIKKKDEKNNRTKKQRKNIMSMKRINFMG